MADSKPDIVEKEWLLQQAIRKKRNKFTWSGLFSIIIGLLITVVGSLLNPSAYSAAGLVIGLGVIIVIIGIIRVLIGIINPLSVDDLHGIHPPGEENT